MERALIILAVAMFACGCVFAHPFDQTYESTIEAVATYETLIGEYPEDLDLRYLLADMQIRAGEIDNAEKTLKELARLDPGYDMAYYRLAEVYYRREEYKRALEPLEKMKDPSREDDKLIAMATVYLKLEKPKKTMELSKKAIEVDEENPGGWLHLGLAHRDLGDVDKALELMEKSLLMDPAQPLVYEWFYELLKEHRPPEEQLKTLKRILREIPYDYTVAVRIGRHIKKLKRGEKDGKENKKEEASEK